MSLLSILTGTPVWVWAIFFHLIFIGLRATKESTLSRSKLLIAPAIFLTFFVRRLGKVVAWQLMVVGLLSLIVGGIINWILTKKVPIKVEDKLITLPGTWQTFILVMMNFSIKYIFGYMHVVNPALATQYRLLEMVASGLGVGLLLGRAFCYYYRSFRVDSRKN